ncbi:hypothetical protein KQI65_04640 [bacterium]|nr:hypothetical protein [bacterium]
MPLSQHPFTFRHAAIAAALCTLMLIGGCSSSNSVEVVHFSPEGEVPLLSTLEIEFSHDLAPPDKQNVWLNDQLIRFSPEISGKYKWTSARRLLFSPDVPLQPMQEYEAEITDLVLYNSGLSSDFDDLTFRTPDFDAVKADVFWTHVPHEYYTVTIQANLHFNYPVQPDQLREFLEVERDGERIADVRIMSEQPSEVIAISIGEVQQEDAEQRVTLIVREGLQSVIGRKPLAETRKFETKLPPITQLAVTGVASGYDGSSGWIEVATTQMVDEEALRKYVRVEPSQSLEYFVSDNIFRIEGAFENAQTVELIVEKGLPGMYGGVLEQEYRQQVSFVDVEPAINFTDRRGQYLMRSGEHNVEVRAVNVDEIEIAVEEVFANNVLHFLNQHRWFDYEYGYNPNFYVGNFGKELYTETVEMSSGQNWLGSHVINLDRVLESRHHGIYVLRVSSSESRWIQDSKIIALSDLAAIARVAEDQIVVFVNSIRSGMPVEGVDVTIISSNNQTLLEGRTDQEGTVVFSDVRERTEGFTPSMVTAVKGDDFNFLDLEDTWVETSRFDVGGLTQPSKDVITFFYGERELYRPGETAHVSAIVRAEDMNTLSDIPVIMKVLSPRGRSFQEYKLVLNSEGSFEQEIDFPDYALTGLYRLELYTGGDKLIGTSSLRVEEFAPDKIRVQLSSKRDSYRPGQEVSVHVDAEYLFGADASNLRYEADVQLRHRPYRSEAYPKYRFDQSSVRNTRIDNTVMDGTLDEKGESDLRYTIPTDINAGGILEGAMYVSVFDLTGRTVNRMQPFTVHANDVYLGIQSKGSYFGVDKPIDFRFIAVDKEDRAKRNLKADVKLVRLEWQTVLKKDHGNRYYYASEEKEVLEWEKRITLNGETPYDVRVTRSGKYELRLSRAGSDSYQKTTFYAYGWASSTASSFEVDKEGRVDIVFDKKEYRPGETAKVLFMCPFAGRLLITVERNGVFHHEYLDVEKRSVELKLPVRAEYLPNAYITATLFRPHDGSKETPFLVGHGFASMSVVEKENHLPVSIEAAGKVKPGTTQTITIKTAPRRNIHVTLAAVDEGILQITDYKTPDPYAVMYARRALQVTSHDLYQFLLPEIVKMASSVGGGADMMEEAARKRTNPITTKRFNLFSFWSGIRKSDGNGRVRVTLKLPQFNGEARLMAVAYSGQRFGSAEHRMKIADDFILEPQLPRLLTAGDSLLMPVTVINTTDKRGKVRVQLHTEGNLSVVSSESSSVVVPANGTAQVQFNVRASDVPGTAKLTLKAGGAGSATEKYSLAVRPRVPFSVDTRNGTLKNGSRVTLPTAENYVRDTRSVSLTVSPFPAIRFAKQLRNLVGYPHGCIEQTVSKAFPQLYLEEVLKLAAPDKYRRHNPVYFVNEAIRKVQAMQLYDGSLAYWPGGQTRSWWGSVYAAHFLIEAKKAKYRVNDKTLSRLLRYIGREAKKRETYDYVHYRGTGRTVELKARKEILYSLYVLAAAGKADLSTMNYYRGRPHLLTRDTRYLLAGSYGLAGKWSSYHKTVPELFRAELPVRQTGGSFDSELRANAIMLNVLLEVDPANKQIPDILRWIANRADRMYSTQETAFVMLALGKAARRSASTDISVGVYVDGKKRASYDGRSIALGDDELGKGSVVLKASGSGEVYYFWSAEGVKLRGDIVEEDANMQVRRNYYDYQTRQRVAPSQFRQGQLLVCEIALSGEGRSVDNVAVTDMLPAGCEIENTRLRASTSLKWDVKDALKVEYLDIRDDRLILFTSLDGERTRRYAYLVRVVNAGRFALPPIGAEAMYDPGIHSYHGADRVSAAPMRFREQ